MIGKLKNFITNDRMTIPSSTEEVSKLIAIVLILWASEGGTLRFQNFLFQALK